jgi:hypothetical protein
VNLIMRVEVSNDPAGGLALLAAAIERAIVKR